MSNPKTCAARAAKLVKAYSGGNDDLEADIVDVATDLMHLCASNESVVSWTDVVRMAHSHFKAEQGDKSCGE